LTGLDLRGPALTRKTPLGVWPTSKKSWTGVEVPRRASLIRGTFTPKLGRILSHCLNVTTQAMDVGALTPPLWGFEEREI